MRERERPAPPSLEGRVQPVVYERWLARKAASHPKRDIKRGDENVTGAAH
jgi:hypothetical protein